jgi:hypothetical protein
MTEFRVRERSNLDTGEVGDWRRDGPMDDAREMAMAVTPAAAETSAVTIFEPTTENGEGAARPW